jgi:di/tricarboxylate transporter
MTKSPVDTESATIASYWLGIAGFLIGVIGISFSIYSAFSKEPDHLLIAGSGWLAAVLVAASAWFSTVKLLRYVKSREDELLRTKGEAQAIRAEHERLLSISEYLVTKTVRKATKRAVPTSVPAPADEESNANAD